ncbi:hypothetical protein BV898_14900 [Hypsibius exemplaris]|uniref:Vesicle transport protein n=1 Tax=Hypsibius exemplaris TaxID=2072580 RepID=A0A9X6NGU0_HYPEX|nr:hypothetical protein BV898_14900 [Hypsibius exemplaris]
MTSPSAIRVDLDTYVKANRAESSRSFALRDKLEGGLNWLKIKRSEETLDDLDHSAETDPWFPSLSKQQRFIGFLGCFFAGCFCLIVASFYIPVLLLKSRKFSVLFTFGSVFIVCSFALLRGPYNHFRSMIAADRLPLTSVYLMSVAATLYFALEMQSTVLTVLAGGVQVFTLIWYTVSYLPGGQTGFKFFTKLTSSLLKKSATTVLSA